MSRMMAAVPIILMVLAHMFGLSAQKYPNDGYCYCYDISPYLKTPLYIGKFANDSIISLSNAYRRNVNESSMDRILYRLNQWSGVRLNIKAKG